MELTYEQSAAGSIAEALGLETDEDGYVTGPNGEYTPVSDGREKLHKSDVGAFEYNEDYPQDTLLVPDTFPEIVEHSRRMEERETDEEAVEEAMDEWLHSLADAHEQESQRGSLVVVAVAVLVVVAVVWRLLRKY